MFNLEKYSKSQSKFSSDFIPFGFENVDVDKDKTAYWKDLFLFDK